MRRELHIIESFGQFTVTTSDGRRGVSATLSGALDKVFFDQAPEILACFGSITPAPEGGQIHEGQASA